MYASLTGLSTAMGDCLRAGKTIAPASPSPAQSAAKGMSSHTMDLAVYAESSSSSIKVKTSYYIRNIKNKKVQLKQCMQLHSLQTPHHFLIILNIGKMYEH